MNDWHRWFELQKYVTHIISAEIFTGKPFLRSVRALTVRTDTAVQMKTLFALARRRMPFD